MPCFSSQSRRIAVLFLLAAALSGCGEKRHGVGVHGKLTIAGRPVEEGYISFIPVEETNGQAVAAEIENGTYRLSPGEGPAAGRHRIEISAPQKTGQKITLPGMGAIDEVIELVPKEFNAESQQFRDLATGDNEFDFEIP